MSPADPAQPFSSSSPYLAWPAFVAASPLSVRAMVEGLEASRLEPAATLAAGRRAQLRLLLEWAVDNVPYYARVPGYAEALTAVRRSPGHFGEQWSRLPILTRPELHAGGDALHAPVLPAGQAPIRISGTSGSTGVSVKVRTTAVTRTIWDALTIREHLWRRRDFSRRLGIIRYLEVPDRVRGGLDLPSWGPPAAGLYATGRSSAIHGGDDVAELVAWMRRFDPHYLLLFPSLAVSLLDAFGTGRPPSLEEVRFMNEPVDPALERRLADQWQVRCAELYSAAEVGYIAFRCAERGSLHVQAETILVEILDDKGRACGLGETGRVVVTPLHNLATPLLRYAIGDYATVGAPCGCGRPHPVLARVRGRVRNMARAPDGRHFWPSDLSDILEAIPAIRQVQYVQTALERIELRVVTERPLATAENDRAVAMVRRMLGHPFRVDVVPVERIARGPTGKFEEFLSLLPERSDVPRASPRGAARAQETPTPSPTPSPSPAEPDGPDGPVPLLQRIETLRKAGDDRAAVALCEQTLQRDPADAEAHGELALLRFREGRMADAFGHGRRAGELSGWIRPAICQRFGYIVNALLATAGSADSAQRRQLHAAESARLEQCVRSAPAAESTKPAQPPHQRPPAAPAYPLRPPMTGPSARPAPASVSVLVSSGADVESVAAGLAALSGPDLRIVELLMPAGAAICTAPSSWPAPVRTVAVPAGNAYRMLDALAAAATGDWLLAIGDEGCSAAALGALRPLPGRWTITVPDDPVAPRLVHLLQESTTAGFALLAPNGLVRTPANLLVPRALHQRIGGYRSGVPDPLLDYCLRLLWEAEPWVAGFPAAPGGPGRSRAGRLAAVDDYLRRALADASAPNAYAPATCNWGLHFLRKLLSYGPFPAADLMDGICDRIAAFLEAGTVRAADLQPGINLVGPARGEFGLSETMRAIARACIDGDIPCAIRDLDFDLGTRQRDDSLAAHFAPAPRHACSLFFLTPASREMYDRSLDALVFGSTDLDFRHCRIGYWFWELEKIPTQWAPAIAKVDEIWVATDFVAQAFRRAADKPVIKIPHPIHVEVQGQYDRRRFDLPERVFLFLFSFDFHSYVARKNPQGLIEAFRRAFPAHRRDVALVVKSTNGTRKPGALENLREAAGHDPRILLRDGYLSRDEVYGLQGVVDCYASLHRAEGLGLGLAESMFQGKPALATGYSGNLEFMTATNSALVDHALVPVKSGEMNYDDPDFVFAEPDLDHAAFLMRRMVDDAAWRTGLARQGAQDIRTRFSRARTAQCIAARLRELRVVKAEQYP